MLQSSEETEPQTRRTKDNFSSRLGLAAGLSAGAGLIHLLETGEHFEHWFGYGLFFLVAGVAQTAYAGLVAFVPERRVFLAGIVGNALILLLYLTTRTAGIPFLGPDAWEVEPVGLVDLVSKAGEGLLMITLFKLSRDPAVNTG